jgi:hypothetical protein
MPVIVWLDKRSPMTALSQSESRYSGWLSRRLQSSSHYERTRRASLCLYCSKDRHAKHALCAKRHAARARRRCHWIPALRPLIFHASRVIPEAE